MNSIGSDKQPISPDLHAAKDAIGPRGHGNRQLPRAVEQLPFTISLVRNEEQMKKAVEIRHSAYARHLPDFARTLLAPEPTDFEAGVFVFLATAKEDGSPLGTIRLQTNTYKPLLLEQSVDLPAHLQGHSLAEATRLGVTPGAIGRLVKTALFKSFFDFCIQHEIEWMVMAARSPLDKVYERLMFSDVFPEAGFVPLRHASNLPHRIMALRVAAVDAMWREAAHPLHGFFFGTQHPDIDRAEDVIDNPLHSLGATAGHGPASAPLR